MQTGRGHKGALRGARNVLYFYLGGDHKGVYMYLKIIWACELKDLRMLPNVYYTHYSKSLNNSF